MTASRSFAHTRLVGVLFVLAAVTCFTGIDTGLGRHVHVTQEIVAGHPAEVLLDTVAASDLLVVGARGQGGSRGGMLGSVSRHVVSHARCPVVIVADPERAPR